MINKQYIDALENLFKENKNIRIEKGENFISFSQDFTNNLAVTFTKELFEREKLTYTHTVTFFEYCTYEAVDRVDTNNIGTLLNDKKDIIGFNLKSGHYKGDFKKLKGFTYGIGKDYNTGEIGFIKQPWDMENIKGPIRDMLSQTGLKSRKVSTASGLGETIKKHPVIIGFIIGINALILLGGFISVIAMILMHQ